MEGTFQKDERFAALAKVTAALANGELLPSDLDNLLEHRDQLRDTKTSGETLLVIPTGFQATSQVVATDDGAYYIATHPQRIGMFVIGPMDVDGPHECVNFLSLNQGRPCWATKNLGTWSVWRNGVRQTPSPPMRELLQLQWIDGQSVSVWKQLDNHWLLEHKTGAIVADFIYLLESSGSCLAYMKREHDHCSLVFAGAPDLTYTLPEQIVPADCCNGFVWTERVNDPGLCMEQWCIRYVDGQGMNLSFRTGIEPHFAHCFRNEKGELCPAFISEQGEIVVSGRKIRQLPCSLAHVIKFSMVNATDYLLITRGIGFSDANHWVEWRTRGVSTDMQSELGRHYQFINDASGQPHLLCALRLASKWHVSYDGRSLGKYGDIYELAVEDTPAGKQAVAIVRDRRAIRRVRLALPIQS